MTDQGEEDKTSPPHKEEDFSALSKVTNEQEDATLPPLKKDVSKLSKVLQALRSTGDKQEEAQLISPPQVEDAALSKALDSLVDAGAAWKSLSVLSNVRYGDYPKQSLDIYFPEQVLLKTSCMERRVPVYIHIHGGGWSRGGKESQFYGGPALSQNAVAAGFIAVAIGYRLGNYPDFMNDCATAIRWVMDHMEELGGDLKRVFLSGHSAGGHIASLLLLRHSTFLAPLEIPIDFFRGLILVSGVYDLFSPLRKAPLDSKNKWFFLAYVLPAFGYDEKLRREASPLLLLEPDKDTSTLGTIAKNVSDSLRQYMSRSSVEEEEMNEEEAASKEAETAEAESKEENTVEASKEEQEDAGFEINTSNLPSTLILNAAFDMGLQENGELMAAAMAKHTTVKYVLVPGTDHASICWNPKAASEINDFIQGICSA